MLNEESVAFQRTSLAAFHSMLEMPVIINLHEIKHDDSNKLPTSQKQYYFL